MTEQDYTQEIDFIFNQFPSYQKVGKIAYKPGIETMQSLDSHFGYPHKCFKTIHIAGTNGKGSTSHMIAAGLMAIKKPATETYLYHNSTSNSNLLKVGLYTSPHLIDFRERIKVNGEMITKEFVYNFIKENKSLFLNLKASFFEITTAMAFSYFKECNVDIAVIECGLGGRLDSTNVITPLISIITNIGLDHCEHLGYSLPDIAFEKSGIIKPNTPVIIGERGEESKCAEVFISQAKLKNAPIFFAEDKFNNIFYNKLITQDLDLRGNCQEKNIKTVASAFEVLQFQSVDDIDKIVNNISLASKLTGLRGRWETLKQTPLVVCDTGHNAHGFKLLSQQISNTYKKLLKKDSSSKLYIVFGVVADKDLNSILEFLPKEGYYFYVNSSGSRALKAKLLEDKMCAHGFEGEAVEKKNGIDDEETVSVGLEKALKLAKGNDFVFIGGSTFVVAEILNINFCRKE